MSVFNQQNSLGRVILVSFVRVYTL